MESNKLPDILCNEECPIYRVPGGVGPHCSFKMGRACYYFVLQAYMQKKLEEANK